jgi:hypothetical protein
MGAVRPPAAPERRRGPRPGRETAALLEGSGSGVNPRRCRLRSNRMHRLACGMHCGKTRPSNRKLSCRPGEIRINPLDLSSMLLAGLKIGLELAVKEHTVVLDTVHKTAVEMLFKLFRFVSTSAGPPNHRFQALARANQSGYTETYHLDHMPSSYGSRRMRPSQRPTRPGASCSILSHWSSIIICSQEGSESEALPSRE